MRIRLPSCGPSHPSRRRAAAEPSAWRTVASPPDHPLEMPTSRRSVIWCEHGRQPDRPGRLGEADDAVQPVVVGERGGATRSSRAASSASSSGCEAPSRKEKFEWQCNSA